MGEGKHSPGEPGNGDINYIKEAFRSQYNWIALIGAAAFAAVSGSLFPILLGAGLELMYLSIIPQNRRFQRLIRSRKYEAEKRRAQARLFDQAKRLPELARRRLQRLQEVCIGIRSNYGQLSATSQIFARQLEERLEGLAQGFLRLLVAEQQHTDYLASTSPDSIRRELAQLQQGLGSDSPKVQEINRRRIEILQKRLEKYDRIVENHKVVQAQCAALEDVLALIRDQSVSMKDPQQVSEQLDGLVKDVERTEEEVRQVESILDLAAPEIGGPLSAPGKGLITDPTPVSPKPLPSSRGKTRN